MNAATRRGALGAAVTLVAVALVVACSSRERPAAPPRTEQPGMSVGGTAKPPPATGSLSNFRTDDELRSACRPAGALGAENPAAPGPFLATFDAATDAPLGVCGASEWDIVIHSRQASTWYSLDPMMAQHGADCAGPPATHELHGEHTGAVFLCRDHLMTSLNASEYGVIYLVPNQLVDLSAGPVVIQFDLSTERMSKRDWVDLWLTPWDQNLALPLEASDPDLQGPPRNSIQVTTAGGENSPVLRTTREGRASEYQAAFAVAPLGAGIAGEVNQSAARQKFQLTVSANRARFERLASPTAAALEFWDEPIDFPFDVAVLQLGHHSYTPTKDGAGTPATWHWDNVSISRAIPFQLIRANERFADREHAMVTFEAPAPSDASLRFSAIGKPEISFDSGRTWTVAQRQDGLGQLEGKHHPEHFSSYWTPAPAGTQEVRVRFKPDDWYTGPYFAQGFSLWAR